MLKFDKDGLHIICSFFNRYGTPSYFWRIDYSFVGIVCFRGPYEVETGREVTSLTTAGDNPFGMTGPVCCD